MRPEIVNLYTALSLLVLVALTCLVAKALMRSLYRTYLINQQLKDLQEEPSC